MSGNPPQGPPPGPAAAVHPTTAASPVHPTTAASPIHPTAAASPVRAAAAASAVHPTATASPVRAAATAAGLQPAPAATPARLPAATPAAPVHATGGAPQGPIGGPGPSGQVIRPPRVGLVRLVVGLLIGSLLLVGGLGYGGSKGILPVGFSKLAADAFGPPRARPPGRHPSGQQPQPRRLGGPVACRQHRLRARHLRLDGVPRQHSRRLPQGEGAEGEAGRL